MADTFKQRDMSTYVGPRPRPWLALPTYLFYPLLALAVGGFLYYLVFFNHLLILYLPSFLAAALITLIASVLSLILAVILGFIGALGRLARWPVFRWIAIVYVEVVRGTPAYVQ